MKIYKFLTKPVTVIGLVLAIVIAGALYFALANNNADAIGTPGTIVTDSPAPTTNPPAATEPPTTPPTQPTTTPPTAPTTPPTNPPQPTTPPTANELEKELIAILTDDSASESDLTTAIMAAGLLPETAELDAAVKVAKTRLAALTIVEIKALPLVDRYDYSWYIAAKLSGDWGPGRPLPQKAINVTATRSPQVVTIEIPDRGDGTVAEIAIVNGVNIRILDATAENDILFSDGTSPARRLANGDSATLLALTEPGVYTLELTDCGVFFYELHGANPRGAVDVFMAECFAKESNVYKHVELDPVTGDPVTVSYDEFGAKVTGAASIVGYLHNGTELAVWSTTRIDLLKRMGDPNAMDLISIDNRVQGVELVIHTNLVGGERNDYTVTKNSIGIFVGTLAGKQGLTFVTGNHFDIASDGNWYEFRVEPGQESKAKELAKEWLLSNGVDLTGLKEYTLN